ncbi:unnamed protein product [Clavelina lepadiformis]|uniref:Uncharacterized protein n=1 Tax=Clavelina lepadiformis TaxID=159417 RepID=A0ABP0FMZ8_CLALP
MDVKWLMIKKVQPRSYDVFKMFFNRGLEQLLRVLRDCRDLSLLDRLSNLRSDPERRSGPLAVIEADIMRIV